MKKYRKKPVVIEAVQWFENGDHPEDYSGIDNKADVSKIEGKVVRRYRIPNNDGQKRCQKCGQRMHYHGWIDTLEGGHIVCPADWIITGIKGEKYPCKPDMFEATYEEVK